MPQFSIESFDDERLEPYRDLKHAAPMQETFIAEGERLVLRLLEGPCRTESILCTAAAYARLAGRFPDAIPVYVASTALICRLIGFRFHRGVLACGLRPPARRLESLWPIDRPGERSLLVICPQIGDPANLGTIIRTAAAFGASGLVASRTGTDLFSRRVLRTSMGSVLRLPIVQTDDWPAVLESLHRAGFETIATVVEPGAAPLSTQLLPARAAILLGNEATGLPIELSGRCRRRITIPMAGASSLNVAVAAGIVLHHFANAADD
ncbi:MAG TPA: RNA methyltransferase [Planctomycetaceae bacterium]|nr:RNA methyltransferase [Planctomycetaceae bacterium]